MSSFKRHIPYLGFHKSIIREICTPQKDDLLIMAKGLGMRRVICALLKTYDRKEDLILVVNATPSDEAGIGDELGIMGVRDPGFRVLTYEMNTQQREDLYRLGGLFSVTSKILVNDLLKGTVPPKLITGLVILHAEKVSHGSQEEFCVRLYRRENQSGFCKAFSDEPEAFAHGMSPLKDMLVNLNMNNVMVWPRYNEAVKTSLATRKAEVVELYQPMTARMREIQDSITECMEAILVELKRDHSLNLDLDDINVRNAQFKNFDTKVRMLLKPVWHKVGAKTKVLVAALTELRNLHTWLLEYDSATFASYINTLQRQHFIAEKLPSGYGGRFQHYWFNAKPAGTLVEASQARVSQRKVVMDNESENPDQPDDGWDSRHRDERAAAGSSGREFEDDEAAMREVEVEGGGDEDVMEIIATQSQPPPRADNIAPIDLSADEEMREIGDDDDPVAINGFAGAPPIFRPVHFDLAEHLDYSVKRRMRKNHEPVLEELPKWSLLAKVLKEIEDTQARTKESHADEPGTNTVLVMVASDRTALQLRQYLTTMDTKSDPPFGPQAGRRMMETLFLSNWEHEKLGLRMQDPAQKRDWHGERDEVYKRGDMEAKKLEEARIKSGRPYYKRRRIRGGAVGLGQGTRANEPAPMSKEETMNAQSAFGGGDLSEGAQMQWALAESSKANGTARTSGDPSPVAGPSSGSTPNTMPPSSSSTSGSIGISPAEATQSLMADASILEEEDLNRLTQAQNGTDALNAAAVAAWMEERGIVEEDFDTDYGLIDAADTVIIRPYGGEDDDILLNELRPRYVVCYEPNLSFIRRLEVYKNSHPGLALRVYQMVYANSFEEDRFLSSMQREDDAFKKLIEDRSSMVIPIYNNNPRAPMRDNVTRAKTTYSSRNAGGSGDATEEARIIVDIREMSALLPSLIDAAGIKVVPATLTVGDYIISPKMCIERKSLPDLEGSFANGRLHTQCESMTAHYEICILLIEFEEDRFSLRTKEDSKRESVGRNKPKEETWDAFLLQSKLVLLTLHFPRLRIIWSSSPHESVRILSDLKLNHDEPEELAAILKGSSSGLAGLGGKELRTEMENTAAVEMLRAIPGVQGHAVKYVLSQVDGIRGLVALSEKELVRILGAEQGKKAYWFLHFDGRQGGRQGNDVEGRYAEGARAATIVDTS